MRHSINGLILIEGYISRIRYSTTRDKIFLEFKDEGDLVFEFRNAKQKRADHVRKLHLNVGEHVIAIGAKCKDSNVYIYGYQVERSGSIRENGYAIYKGTLTQVIPLKQTNILYIRTNPNKNPVVVKADNLPSSDLSSGKNVCCFCYSIKTKECSKPCSSFNTNKCDNCQFPKTDYKNIAIEMRG